SGEPVESLEISNELGNPGIGDCRVVPDRSNASDLLWLLQEVIEVAAPACWVLARAQSLDPGPIKNGFDAAAYACGGYEFRSADRLEDLDDQVCVDVGNRELAEHRVCIGFERVAPLQRALAVAPPRLARCDELLGAVLE